MISSAAPGVVSIIAIVGTSDTTTIVFWTPPSQPNGVITGYQIIYSLYGDTANRMNVTGNEDSFAIMNLSESGILNIMQCRFIKIGWILCCLVALYKSGHTQY